MAKQSEAALDYMLESVRKFVDIVIRARDLGGILSLFLELSSWLCSSSVFDMGDVRNVYKLGVKYGMSFAQPVPGFCGMLIRMCLIC